MLRQANVPVVMDVTHACQSPPSFMNPNHSSGNRELVAAFARAAVAIGVDGIFIELHPDVDNAPVDTQLQLPFKEFEALLTELTHIANATEYYHK